MKSRLLKKVISTCYDAANKGDFKLAYSKLQKIHPTKQREILNVFNEQTFKNLGTEKGTNIVINFAGYRGLQQGLKKVGGTNGITQKICESMSLNLNKTIEKASQQVIDQLPQTTLGWEKLMLKDEWIKFKNFNKSIIEKIKNRFNSGKTITKTNPTVKSPKVVSISKNISDKYKPIMANLEGKMGQEFVDTAYENMVRYMKLDKIAPKKITINNKDGILSVNGGYDYINNAIGYSQGFLEKLTPKQQMNLISHELKHCEQFNNILRTENIGVNEYAKAIAESSLKQSLGKSSFDFMLKNKYENALKKGKGEEFISKTIDNWSKELIPKIETNFSETLKLPKIKADSLEGKKAIKDLEALRNYEGLNIFGFGSEKYKNNPLEVEAYAFGDDIEKLFNSFTS